MRTHYRVLATFLLLYESLNMFTFSQENDLGLSRVLNSDRKYLVVGLSALGLANRLRIMASFYAIAKSSNRDLIVLWNSASSDCKASFTDLFAYVPQSEPGPPILFLITLSWAHLCRHATYICCPRRLYVFPPIRPHYRRRIVPKFKFYSKISSSSQLLFQQNEIFK